MRAGWIVGTALALGAIGAWLRMDASEPRPAPCGPLTPEHGQGAPPQLEPPERAADGQASTGAPAPAKVSLDDVLSEIASMDPAAARHGVGRLREVKIELADRERVLLALVALLEPGRSSTLADAQMNENMVAAALASLGTWTIAPLASLLGDLPPAKLSSSLAQTILRSLAWQGPEGVVAIRDFVSTLDPQHASARTLSLTISSLLRSPPESSVVATETLLMILAMPHPKARASALQALAEYSPLPPQAVQAVRDALAAAPRDGDVRVEAACSLATAAGDAEPLLRLLAETGTSVSRHCRERAMRVVTSLPVEAVPDLLEQLVEPRNALNAELVATALGRRADVPAERFRPLLEDGERADRVRCALAAIRELGGRGETLTPDLRLLLNSPVPETRPLALECLVLVAGNREELAWDAARMLGDESRASRVAAARAFQASPTWARVARDALARAAQDEDPDVRRPIEEALRATGMADEGVAEDR